jgi:hypothetical protein
MLSRSDLSRIIYSTTVCAAVVLIAIFVWQNQSRVESAILTTNPERLPNFDIRDVFGALDRSAIFSPEANSVLGERRGRSRVTVLRDFISRRADLFGIGETKTSELQAAADYTNPDGALSFVSLTQNIEGIPVFQGEVKAGFTKGGEMFRVVNNLAANIDYNNLAKEFGVPESSMMNAAQHIGLNAAATDTVSIDSGSNQFKTTFESGQFSAPTTAEKMYFPVSRGVVRPSWRVLFWTEHDAYYVIVDAVDGTLYWRKNIVEHQTLPATFNVYGNSTSPMKTADSPTPFTPGCLALTGCPQPPIINRTSFTLVGNEVPYGFNNIGWIPDTGLPVRTPADANITDGNNVEAGIDRDGTQGVDNNGWAFGNPTRVFNSAYNPAPGNPPPGDDPTPPNPQTYPPTPFQQGITTHGFYIVNRFHDETYRLGFTEQAGNFQHFNFGRGGSEGDRVSFEIQDSSGTNGANFATPADGGRGRMQMFLWTGPTPDRDGTLDTQVVVHEMTHGLTNRLHANSTGLNSNMARGMGEGWSDFYALALLSEPADNPYGTYTSAGYITYQITPGFESNYYYGIRRFPNAVWNSTGSNGCRHNPLTFADIDSTQVNIADGCFPPGPIGSPTADQIHNIGEVWAVTLWEVRGKLIEKHGAAEGNRRAMQYVMDGMKLSPINPTILQSRDAILAATQASDASDLRPVWQGFAIRGMGTLASIQAIGSGSNNTRVTQSFDLPVMFRSRPRADFDGDGKTDVSVFRPSDTVWYLNRSTAGFAAASFGLSTDIPAPGDYDDDGKADIAVFRPGADAASPDFYIFNSSNATVSYVNWGAPADIPAVGDYDGDRRDDPAIFRPSTHQFWVLQSSNGGVLISRPVPGNNPVTGDFDGDGKGDFGSFGGGTWTASLSSTGHTSGVIDFWGLDSDKLVPADYDGDGKDDFAVFRPSNGIWYIRRSSGGESYISFGISTDVPVPGDYDGDGKSDQAVYRDGTWYLNRSTSGFAVAQFGLTGDFPIPKGYLP